MAGGYSFLGLLAGNFSCPGRVRLYFMFLTLTAAFLLTSSPPAASTDQGTLRLVESFPLETTLDAPDLPETAQVWIEMIAAAKREILLSHFYACTAEESSLNDVVEALQEAAGRGVAVRFLLAERFRETYPDLPAQLDAVKGIEVRFVDYKEVAGGVMHAKFMAVDSERVFLGSPNFDFRAMEHIQELGVDIENGAVAQGLRRVFSMDWVAAGGDALALPDAPASAYSGTAQLVSSQAAGVEPATKVTLCASPKSQLPPGVQWDLPLLVDLIGSAQKTVRAQVLTYDATGYDRGYFATLETALRSAAARGVRVQLLVADWCKRKSCVDGLQSLAALRNVEVSFAVVPVWSQEFVPFSRVVHAKFCVADERAAWVGTSNWEGSYFTTSRNVGVILEGDAAAARLARWFDRTWSSEYKEPCVPGAAYTPPRRD
jgi:phosphatidylserine/phosphatidylglycerophosphate/cardiolipin synthase-like enzyme